MIVRGEIRPFRLRLRTPLETGRGRIREREGVLLTLYDSDGRCGIGEASPIPGGSSAEGRDVRACSDALEGVLPRLEGRSSEDAVALLAGVEEAQPAARFGLESALVDLSARRRGVRAADWLAGGRAPHPVVPVNVLINGSSPEEVRIAAELASARGFGTCKLKVGVLGLGEDTKRVDALREAMGPHAMIRLDANGAWSPEEAREALAELSRFEIEYVEDPIHIGRLADVRALGELRAASPVAFASDEGAVNPVLRREILATKAADWLILKPSALGGLTASRRVAREAWAAGVRAVVTSGIDSAVGLTATMHLAASLEGELFPCGLATAGLLMEDVAAPPPIQRGRMRLSGSPGFGIDLREPSHG